MPQERIPSEKAIVLFLYEMGMLRRIKHEGWRIIGVDNPESVADHSLRAAQIAYFLARMESYPNPDELVTLMVFHDSGEARVGDVHKIANRYIQCAEEKALEDQMSALDAYGDEILKRWKEMEERKTHAAHIAKDADYLEQAITAKEFVERGFEYANDWIQNVSNALHTESAKKLLKLVRDSNSNDWWQGLKKVYVVPKS